MTTQLQLAPGTDAHAKRLLNASKNESSAKELSTR